MASNENVGVDLGPLSTAIAEAQPESFNFTVVQSRNLLLIRYRRPMDLADRMIALPLVPLQAVLAEVTWRLCRHQLQIPPQQVLVEWVP